MLILTGLHDVAGRCSYLGARTGCQLLERLCATLTVSEILLSVTEVFVEGSLVKQGNRFLCGLPFLDELF